LRTSNRFRARLAAAGRRFARAVAGRERTCIAVALAIIFLIFAGFVAIHLIVSGRQLREWVNTDPEELRLDYESGSSWVPGILHIRGLTMRGSDENVQWWFRMEDARISISLIDLFRHRFHATSVKASGLVFHLREKKEKRELNEAHGKRVPKIPGFPDPPLNTEPPKPPPPKEVARREYWTVFVEGLVADPAPEIWIELYRFHGHARVTGSFLIRPHVEAWVGPAVVRFLSGTVTLGREETVIQSASGLGTCVIRAYDPERVRGSHVWPFISGRMQMEGQLAGFDFVDYFLRRSKEPRLAGGTGHLSGNVVFEHGIGRGEARFEARAIAARYRKGTLTGRAGGRLAVSRWDMARNILEISGSRIDLTEIATSGASHDERDWWGHFEFPSGQLRDGLTANTVVEARDARPLYTLFRADLPGWAEGLLKLEGIRSTARVRLSSDLVDVRDLEAEGGKFHISGEYSERGDRERGAFLVRTGLLSVGIDIEEGKGRLKLLGARKWFEETRSSWRGSSPSSP